MFNIFYIPEYGGKKLPGKVSLSRKEHSIEGPPRMIVLRALLK
jgi:hypothetical protein